MATLTCLTRRLVSMTLSLVSVSLLVLPGPVEAQSEESPPLDVAPEAFAADLFTGAATFGVPIVVPPGLAGLDPRIVLRYNSGSVDKLGKREQAQSTGLGWTLDIGGAIVRDAHRTGDESDDTFRLVFGGVKYDLVQVDATTRTWHARDETFWRIQRNPSGTGDEWLLTTKDGMRYRFGATSDSRFVGIRPGGGSVLTYKWVLSHVITPNGVETQCHRACNSPQVGATNTPQPASPEETERWRVHRPSRPA